MERQTRANKANNLHIYSVCEYNNRIGKPGHYYNCDRRKKKKRILSYSDSTAFHDFSYFFVDDTYHYR